MKNNLLKLSSRAASLALTLAAIGLSPSVRAQNSPVGAWDCVLSGQRQGTAYFQFNEDGSFIVNEVLVPNEVNTSSSSTTGRGGEGIGRNGDGGSDTNVFTPNPQIFGSEETNGFWAFDPKGRTIGFFVETSEPEDCSVAAIPTSTNTSPNSIPVSFTNGSTTDPTFCITTPTATNGSVYTETMICYTNVPSCTAITNAISFVGTVSPKRMLLKCTTPFGDTTYEGVPFQVLPDISGFYSGVKKQDGITFQEFLVLTNTGLNTYAVGLTGPGYAYAGESILSSQKKISFSLGLIPAIPTNQNITVVRAVFGPFNAKKMSANMVGWDGTQGIFTDQARFSIEQIAVP